MMTLADVERLIARAMKTMSLAVERVSDLVFTNTQAATGKGAADQPAGGEVGGLYGVMSRPPDGADGILLKIAGKGANSILIGYRHRQYELKLDKGEVALFDDQGQKFILGRGGITISAKTDLKLVDDQGNTIEMSSAGIVMNGGTLKIARETDGVTLGTLGPCTAGPYPVNLTFTPEIATGGEAIGPGSPVSGSTVSLTGVITPGGAPKVKA